MNFENLLKFAAIDIGSNAIRLLLAGVQENGGKPAFHKMSLIRMPLRLGPEAFTKARLSESMQAQLMETMSGFEHLIAAYRPLNIMACATAALRAATNGVEICKRIRGETGIHIEIIDGKREAQILLKNNCTMGLGEIPDALFVDVGGGSTELSVLHQGRIVQSESFPIGTLRSGLDTEASNDWLGLQRWLARYRPSLESGFAIGSGGNINKIFFLVNGTRDQPISYRQIQDTGKMLEAMSLDQRISRLGLRPDRADVIVPAAYIYLRVMEWAGIQKMMVPILGLADGMIQLLYSDYLETRMNNTGTGNRK